MNLRIGTVLPVIISVLVLMGVATAGFAAYQAFARRRQCVDGDRHVQAKGTLLGTGFAQDRHGIVDRVDGKVDRATIA